MGTWSRSEKIGAWSLVVAIVGCAGTLSTVNEVRMFFHRLPQSGAEVERTFTATTAQSPSGESTVARAEPLRPTESAPKQTPVATDAPLVGSTPTPRTSLDQEITGLAASSSSVLPTSSVASYGPVHVLDGNAASVWVEGADGYGTGEWIQLDLSSPTTVSRVQIANGYDRGPRFYENGRVRDASLTFSDGSTQHIHLLDVRGLQEVPISAVHTASVRLTIASAYGGTRWEDTAIGEIRLWGTP